MNYEQWTKEFQRIGDAIGLKGAFTVDYGTDNIIAAFLDRQPDIDRACEMLNIAATYIRNNCVEDLIYYDGTDCDGYCVATDCDTAAEMLNGKEAGE